MASSTAAYSENALVEQPAIALFAQLGYETANCFHEQGGGSASTLGRETTNEVILTPRLRAALERLNPDVGREVIDGAIQELARDRGAMSPAHANRDVYRLLKDGVKVSYQDGRGSGTGRGRSERDRSDIAKSGDFCACPYCQ